MSSAKIVQTVAARRGAAGGHSDLELARRTLKSEAQGLEALSASLGEAFIQNACAFIDQRQDAAANDLFVTYVALGVASLFSNFAREHADQLGPSTFYWGTGVLSGVLDNAPTYLNFLSASMGKFGLNVDDTAAVHAFAEGVSASGPETIIYLVAISVAAVFFGAMTYIGNAPNFMVKAICESNGAETPSFGGYIVKYSLPILIPVYAVVWLVFFSGYVL